MRPPATKQPCPWCGLPGGTKLVVDASNVKHYFHPTCRETFRYWMKIRTPEELSNFYQDIIRDEAKG